MRFRFLCSGILALFLGAHAIAGDDDGKRRRPGIVDPKTAQANAERLLKEVTWQTDLQAALADARRTGRLVFWMQVKGRLDADT